MQGAHPVRRDPRQPPPPLGSDRVTCGAWPPAAARPTGVPRTMYGRLLQDPDEKPGCLIESRSHKRLGPGSGIWRSARNRINAAAMVPRAAPAQWSSDEPQRSGLGGGHLQRLRRGKTCELQRLRCQNLLVSARLAAKSTVSAGSATCTLATWSLRVLEETSYWVSLCSPSLPASVS